jgi:hypothetical protein
MLWITSAEGSSWTQQAHLLEKLLVVIVMRESEKVLSSC